MRPEGAAAGTLTLLRGKVRPASQSLAAVGQQVLQGGRGQSGRRCRVRAHACKAAGGLWCGGGRQGSRLKPSPPPAPLPAGKLSRASCRTRPRWCSRCRAPSARTGSRTCGAGGVWQGCGVSRVPDSLARRRKQDVPARGRRALPACIPPTKGPAHEQAWQQGGAHMALSRMGPSTGGASTMAARGSCAGLCACASTALRRRATAVRRRGGGEGV